MVRIPVPEEAKLTDEEVLKSIQRLLSVDGGADKESGRLAADAAAEKAYAAGVMERWGLIQLIEEELVEVRAKAAVLVEALGCINYSLKCPAITVALAAYKEQADGN